MTVTYAKKQWDMTTACKIYTAMSWIDPELDEATPLAGVDVLLDGDSAFVASAVSDLRILPEHARATANPPFL
ncbi:hypothetical protein KIN20_031859 [Parelaphostrongylus tenuis]|uniref:Uncharacterized protein n=1 Tax=Parelaphostrongylus tenuis TaxID=148309 RepID=A0AAD5R625_PARTN|nr:hypothetical protein KIN20_031859 [Parelaphostrongylus tenuis]